MAPQKFGLPAPPSAWAPPQKAPASQLPQLSALPQPSGAVPHSRPSSAQVYGWQPQALEPLAAVMQMPVPHVPQLMKSPQPSLTLPQLAPSAGHVLPTHAHDPFRHSFPLAHMPQSMAWPHPSFWVSHAAPTPPSVTLPSSAQVFGAHPSAASAPESTGRESAADSISPVSATVESTALSTGGGGASIGIPASPPSTTSENSPSASGPATMLHDVESITVSSTSPTSESAHSGFVLNRRRWFDMVTRRLALHPVREAPQNDRRRINPADSGDANGTSMALVLLARPLGGNSKKYPPTAASAAPAMSVAVLTMDIVSP
jgi:hypothetical protein